MSLDKNARLIGNEIVFGDLQKAQSLWDHAKGNLSAWEVSELRFKVRKVVKELDSAKLNLEASKGD